MGRDVTGLRIDKRASEKSSDSTRSVIRVAPKASPEKTGNAGLSDGHDEVAVKSTNGGPGEKIINSEAIPADHADGSKDDDSNVKVLSKSSDLDSPKSGKKSQSNPHFMSRKQLCDEEDNWSLASSTATSVRTKITVPVAPKFTCVDRLERRKEFYTKLEEKHKALEKEKLEYEARIKEEEQAAIKQLRKSMVVKAKPVPSFYREGPPPKAELKKLPVTRAKSPNLTRRKSCGDAAKTSPDDKPLSGRVTRHSVGQFKDGKASPILKKSSSPVTPKGKDRTNGPKKVKSQQKPKDTPAENSPVKEPEPEPGNGDLSIVES
ncbi:TPX2 (targeting protein for Xklp2) protein family [Striga hermonthica]|uniref:TPX2 (Targeting protein for Xklp2) protein family n=1 Tax=Striga hermonthica TaxID=68872 RepID=A0A9N7R573_STRHE|nr:TPX2 (targeting protein for Xklp2) protein family [Striga hermonthica]